MIQDTAVCGAAFGAAGTLPRRGVVVNRQTIYTKLLVF